MHVESPMCEGPETAWWRSLLTAKPLTALQFHDKSENDIVNVAGILGFIQVEEKKVRSDNKNLLVLHLTDRTGRFEIRSWNHSDTEFLQYHEKPIQLKRVRVSMYGGQRVGELLDGPQGTVVSTDFDSSDLRSYWQE